MAKDYHVQSRHKAITLARCSGVPHCRGEPFTEPSVSDEANPLASRYICQRKEKRTKKEILVLQQGLRPAYWMPV